MLIFFANKRLLYIKFFITTFVCKWIQVTLFVIPFICGLLQILTVVVKWVIPENIHTLPRAASSSGPPPCLRKFQNAQALLALGIPNRSTPPCLRNSVIIQTPLRNCRFFLPTDLKSPLYIPNTFIKRKLIFSLPSKEKTYIQHNKQSTLRNNKQRPTE